MPWSWNVLALLVALGVDAVVGEPQALWRRWPHPVVVIGRAIAWCDRRFNVAGASRWSLRRRGEAFLAALLLAAVLAGGLASLFLRTLPLGWVLEGILASTLIAQRSLHEHVEAVRAGLRRDGLAGGRAAIALIVGRDPETLDVAGVARAAIESLAENFSDGVVAPAFWYAVAGLPGLLAYKALNTADSMIGHRSPRHLHFGRAAARCDDLANLVPARLAGILLVAAAWVKGAPWRDAWSAMRADAGSHTSPNAGWPEAAMGGALGLALAGPRRYGGTVVDGAWMNREGRQDADADDIGSALTLFRTACWLGAALAALCLAELVFL